MVIIKDGGNRPPSGSRIIASNLSDRLQALVDRDGKRIAPVKVRLRADLSETTRASAVQRIKSLMTRAEYLSISGTVHGQMPMNAIALVSDLPEVEWIDVEQEVPIEELLDTR
jgi:hypothetical protein